MSAENVRILVVDDTPANRYAVARTLRGEGFEVIEAGLGFEALELARTERPDLVVLDVNLPDIAGFEVAKRLRASPETESVSIMHLSATFTDAVAHAHGLSMGADAYLTHPFDPHVLIATARALVRLRSAERRMADLLELERAARAEAERAQRAAEEAGRALRASETRFRRLSESGLIGLIRWDLDGPILEANDAFLRMLGYTRQELAAGLLDMHALTPLELHELMRESVDKLRVEGISQHEEKQYLCKDGTRVDALVASAMLEGSSEALTLALDITARRRTEYERNRLLAELEGAIRARDEFLAIASHDLRNPLSTLQLQLEVLLVLAKRGPEALAAGGAPAKIELASRHAKQLVVLFEDLLDVSRIGSGRLDIQRQRMDLAEAARGVCSRMRDQFDARGCELHVLADIPVIGNWDRIRIEQVLNNLLSNALKYGESQPVFVSVDATLGHAHLAVRDHGVGIEPENRERIFRQFERVGGDAKSFGLGLWIVQRVVDALGGKISVDSEVGQGSTFLVVLPLVEA